MGEAIADYEAKRILIDGIIEAKIDDKLLDEDIINYLTSKYQLTIDVAKGAINHMKLTLVN